MLGQKNEPRAFRLNSFLKQSNLAIVDANQEIFSLAGNIRLKYRKIRLSTADSIMIATAIMENVSEVVSKDYNWKAVSEINLSSL